MFDFEKLSVYQKAREFRKEVKQVLSKIRNSNLKDQLDRASLSIVLNIAEGAGKFSPKDKINFYRISKGSCSECVPLIQELSDDKIISETTYQSMYNQLTELSKMQVGLIKSQSSRG